MPFISTKTSAIITKEQELQLKERLGQAISIIPGKSENWLMLAIEGDIPMYFKGDNSQPVAFIEVKIYGGASSEVYEKMTAELTSIYGDILGIAPNNMYIRYFGSDDWGWNGSNF
ncbi:phenylpyruvate tautomerase MIF-related protein [Butyrivibrio sp. MC2013]|uniref:phenylpyruvate tautomerase MIF-related protein n=1 Tax=Butyrivibrio sp. MC2013 TaxID=1280686 RepID=UPI000409C0BC|nr:phenylpyruvate tautomerase MIF-related protein [Butyrivibrio sp. MC2013]